MCGRYYVDDDTAKEIEKIINQVNQKIKLNHRDVCPTQQAPVVYQGKDSLDLTEMKWGFPNYTGKGVIFNARCETASQKGTFKDSMHDRRCVIPAAGFYEWDKAKNKVQFERTDSNILYLAGIWKNFNDAGRFVILTSAANESVAGIHDRMPLILEEKEIEPWVCDYDSVEFILNKSLPQLKVIKEYDQMKLEL